jgi:preprotein translocase subunit SecY
MYTNLNVFDNFYLILVTVIPMILNFIPAFRGVCLGGIGLVIVGGGFIEMMTLLDNALKAEEDKAKMAGREKRGKNYKK